MVASFGQCRILPDGNPDAFGLSQAILAAIRVMGSRG